MRRCAGCLRTGFPACCNTRHTFATVAPLGRRWSEREEAIRLSRDRVERLRGLAARKGEVLQAATIRDSAMGAMPRRLLRGRTAALAASELQRILQEYAHLSRVSINRLDVASEDRTGEAATLGGGALPANISAVSDIYGLADLLARLQHGTVVLEVSEVGATSSTVLRGESLQLSLVVRAPYVVAP